jgi:hypothetical protein
MKRLLVLVLFAAFAAPAAALADDPAPTPDQTANAICKAELKKLGSDTFKATYGTNANKANAFGKCVSKNATTADHATANAAKDCKAERQKLGEDAFATKYGTNGQDANGHGANGKGKNAFGKCVSQHAQSAVEHEADETASAAKACKAERAKDPTAFKKKYGNFGHCVSGK